MSVQTDKEMVHEYMDKALENEPTIIDWTTNDIALEMKDCCWLIGHISDKNLLSFIQDWKDK